MRFIILRLIGEQPRHGYEIIKAIEDAFGGTYSPSPGVVYPTLTLLEELGHATVTAEAGKKRYAITEAGSEFLAANQATADAAAGRMDDARRRIGGGPPPQLVRAMENLKLALSLRLSRGAITDDEIRRLAAALDAAVAEIERG
ncbi:MAG TPA: PadR family transcriptional regulator [Stellaceae bacterium]|nr:PadR family transcriptional regulator [Stellaceae bacterium]